LQLSHTQNGASTTVATGGTGDEFCWLKISCRGNDQSANSVSHYNTRQQPINASTAAADAVVLVTAAVASS